MNVEHLELLLGINGTERTWNNDRPSKPDLSKAPLANEDLSRTDLAGVDLSGADLRWVDLSEADLRGADLTNADLRWSLLNRADLTGAKMYDALLRHASFIYTSYDENTFDKTRGFDRATFIPEHPNKKGYYRPNEDDQNDSP